MGAREEIEEQIRLREKNICVICIKKIRFWQSTGNTAAHINCAYNKIRSLNEI